MADKAAGTASPLSAFGIASGGPETVDSVISSPGSPVSSGFSPASKKPQWTVSGPASTRCLRIRPSYDREKPADFRFGSARILGNETGVQVNRVPVAQRQSVAVPNEPDRAILRVGARMPAA